MIVPAVLQAHLALCVVNIVPCKPAQRIRRAFIIHARRDSQAGKQVGRDAQRKRNIHISLPRHPALFVIRLAHVMPLVDAPGIVMPGIDATGTVEPDGNHSGASNESKRISAISLA
jgi:hypothetical protein